MLFTDFVTVLATSVHSSDANCGVFSEQTKRKTQTREDTRTKWDTKTR